MSNEKEKWIEEVFQSMKGSKRAQPRKELFAKIQNQIGAIEPKVIPLHHMRYAAAVAILLLILNAFALQQFQQSNTLQKDEMISSTASYNQSIISDYKIYE